jgi:hypothetical protein
MLTRWLALTLGRSARSNRRLDCQAKAPALTPTADLFQSGSIRGSYLIPLDFRSIRNWTPIEDESLKLMALSGRRADEIVVELHRTVTAVHSRANSFGPSLKQVGWKRRGK